MRDEIGRERFPVRVFGERAETSITIAKSDDIPRKMTKTGLLGIGLKTSSTTMSSTMRRLQRAGDDELGDKRSLDRRVVESRRRRPLPIAARRTGIRFTPGSQSPYDHRERIGDETIPPLLLAFTKTRMARRGQNEVGS